MKHLRYLTLALGAMVALSLGLTSCNDDDDDNYRELTPQEKLTAYMSVAGSYSGRLVYLKSLGAGFDQTKSVSVPVSWNIGSEKELTVSEFPIEAITEYMKDGELRDALLAEPGQPLTCDIDFITLSPVSFIVNPRAVTYNLYYGGAAHTVKFVFYVNTYTSYGQFAEKDMAMQFMLAGAYVDEAVRPDLFTVQESYIPYVITTKAEEAGK